MCSKKKTLHVIAAALVVIVSGVAVFPRFFSASAARSTFTGLEDLLKENSENNIFQVAEVVPEKSMGSMGYYVDGSEPMHYVLNGLASASDRYAYIENQQNILMDTGIMGEEGTTDRPLQKTGYEEVYEGAVSPEEFEQYAQNGDWNELKRRPAATGDHRVKISANRIPENTVTIGTVSTNTVRGFDMETGRDENGEIRGDFVPFYEPADKDEAGRDIMADDLARQYLLAMLADNETPRTSTYNGSLVREEDPDVSKRRGIFDPYLVFGGEAGNDYRCYPRMESVSTAYGYTADIDKSFTIDIHNNNAVVPDGSANITDLTLYAGSTVYRFIGDVFVPAGILQYDENSQMLRVEPYSGVTLTNESEDVGEEAGSRTPEVEILVTPDDGLDSSEQGDVLPPTETDVEESPLASGNQTTGAVSETIEVHPEEMVLEQEEEEDLPADMEEITVGVGGEDSSEGNTGTSPAGLGYYLLRFEYDWDRKEEVHYQVTEVRSVPQNSSSGTYLLNDSCPLVPNGEGTGMLNPDFEKIDRMSVVYHYFPGEGIYKMVKKETTDEQTETAVYGSRILYRGGLVNNEWFKEYVFERELDKGDYAYLKVTTVTPAELMELDLMEVDLLYFTDSSGELLPCKGNYLYTAYGTPKQGDGPVNDITYLKIMEILQKVSEERYPVIVDNTLFQDAEGDSHIHILARLLAQKSVGAFYRENSGKSEEELNAETVPSDFIKDDDYHFVNDSVYAFRRDIKNIAGREFDAGYEDDAVKDGFEEVLKEVKKENAFIKEANTELPSGQKKSLIPEKISDAVAIQYILSALSRRGIIGKDEIRVLEIQPYWAEKSSTNRDCIVKSETDGTATTYSLLISGKKVIEDSPEKITLTKMSTGEFIGKTEDLNSNYDLIYIGLNTGYDGETKVLYPTNQNMNGDGRTGRTRYNDSSMNGLVYTNVGDLTQFDTSWVRNFGKGATTRYSGNDITEEKMEDLKEYVDARYPLIFAQNFYTGTDDGQLRVYDKRDNSDVPSGYIDNSSYMYQIADYAKHSMDKNVFRFMDDRGIEDMERLEFYIYKARPSIDLNEAESGIYRNEYNEQYLKYSFIVTNKGNVDRAGTFKAELFVDQNADGRFSRVTELVNNYYVTDGSGNRADANALQAGVRYYLIRPMSKEHTGVVTWKLELSQTEAGRRNSVTGYWPVASTEKIKIKALQINTSGSYATTWNMEEQLKNPNSLLYKYGVSDPNVRNYNIMVKTITSSQFDQMIEDGILDPQLLEYDMLILGFADVCSTPTTEKGMAAVKNFVESGRSVLFTHDTTSMVDEGCSSAKDMWGEAFTDQLRDRVGLDRYGIMGNTGDEHEQAYKPNSNRKTTDDRTHGFTTNLLESQRKTSYSRRNLKYEGKYDRNNIFANNWSASKCMIQKINSGQITDYPYKIEDQVTAAKTHAQYYQINLNGDADHDGEEDIVVWYTLDASLDKNGKEAVWGGYTCYPGDVRNNYYIYNRGNVTYSGAGHSSMESGNDEEVKLFVNTLIASYYTGIKPPLVSIIENGDIRSNPVENIYAPFDAGMTDVLEDSRYLAQTADLYFYVSDLNLIKESSELSVKIYYEDVSSSDTIHAGTDEVAVSEIDLNMYPITDVSTNVVMQAQGEEPNSRMVEDSKVYRAVIPANLLNARNGRQIYIVASDRVIVSQRADEKIVTNYDDATLTKLQLFNLE